MSACVCVCVYISTYSALARVHGKAASFAGSFEICASEVLRPDYDGTLRDSLMSGDLHPAIT